MDLARGSNSIALYVFSNTLTPQFRHSVNSLVGLPLSQFPEAGPVITMGMVVSIAWGLCYWLYRKQIFFKI